MHLRFSEFGHEYESYSFGYTVHGAREAGDNLTDLYAQGFLPYSSIGVDPNLFYMSRSVRVPVGIHTPSSENRRILKKFNDQFNCTYLEGDELKASPSFRALMLAYFAERHGTDIMPPERLEQILKRDIPLRAAEYRHNDVPVAYVLEVVEGSFLHYWYSCYDLTHANGSLGMWLMLDAIRRAQEEHREYVYLGTAYGEKGRYKTNIAPLEFWDGNTWNSDSALLSQLMKKDAVD
ncbi:MAG: hypothetical protein AB202_03790 [Parcubacteria bacterium C7867-007]|nr:MAG: hypothetical protein AB202_03790 [Parcubacteria bacterium C7867-007]